MKEKFIEESKKNKSQKQLTLSARLPENKRIIDEAFDVPNISKYLDFMVLRTSDLNENATTAQHIAPLFLSTTNKRSSSSSVVKLQNKK